MIRRRAAHTLLILLFVTLGLSACRSAFVETTIANGDSAAVRLIEVDYPSASFGVQSLDAHAVYHYHFKIQGSGPITITWTDSTGKVHTSTGPVLFEGQHGDLRISINASNVVHWNQNFSGN
jgi:osmotically-inducible protein OsmY